MTTSDDVHGHDEFDAQLAAFEAEYARIGVTHADVLLLLEDDFANDPELVKLVDTAGEHASIFFGPISFEDELEVLRTLPAAAGREAFLSAFRALRTRQAAERAERPVDGSSNAV